MIIPVSCRDLLQQQNTEVKVQVHRGRGDPKELKVLHLFEGDPKSKRVFIIHILAIKSRCVTEAYVWNILGCRVQA